MEEFAKVNDIRYPVVLGKRGGAAEGELRTLMTREDLAGCKGDHVKFLALLRLRAKDQAVPLEESSQKL